jgi:putative ABC transport system permease protein
MSTLIHDTSYAFRQLRKSPGFTAVAVITLALGIGASTAIFSVVNAVLLRALPFDEPEKIVQLWSDPIGDGRGRNSVAGAEFNDWKEQITTMEAISAVCRVHLNLTGDGHPERLNVLQVSASYLQILRVQPILGRGFGADEDQPGKGKVVVLTHRLWQRYFGGETNLVGRPIQLGGESYTVIGVLPARPRLPRECDVLVPFVFGSESWHHSRRDNRLRVVGRLKAEVTAEQARTEMLAIRQGLKSLYPKYKQDWGVAVVPLHEEVTGQIRAQLWILFSAVGFVLLIACANVAGLLLAKTAARQKEMAMRVALGAGRWRIVRQLLTESVVLSLLGGGLGLLLAFWGVDALKQWSVASLPRVEEIGIDLHVLGFALLAAIATGLLFGLAPAWQLSRPNLNETLKEGGRTSRSNSGVIRGGLIVVEVALAVVLLAGTGLLLKTVFRLQSVPAGFDAESVLAMDISVNDQKYPNGERRAAFLKQIIQRIESLPGVEAAGSATTLPMSGATDNSVRAESQPDQDEFYINTDYDFVSGNYYRAMGIRLLKGRVFAERDNATSAPRVALINESLARQVFPDGDPLGQRVRFLGESWEIVGNVRHRGLDRNRTEHIYLPQAFSFLQCSLVVRTKVPPLMLVETIRSEIFKLDREQPISNIRTLEQVVAHSIADRRLVLVLLGLFAGVALLLAAIGLYGVMAYSVAQRTREIGIRVALGAEHGEVLYLIVAKGMKLTAIGVGVGLLGALILTRVLTHLLFGVTPSDPVTLAAVALVLGAAALLACWLPARRAARVDPMKALRCE